MFLLYHLASVKHGGPKGKRVRLTKDVFDRANSELAGSQAREYQLKGFETSTLLFAA
jgi:hypothetical protein